MDFRSFLSSADAELANRTLGKMRCHGIESLVLTGGLAIELHLLRLGLLAETRVLNDMDFLVESFPEIPTTISVDMLFRHVHPHDPPGKTLLQCVDPETAERVDIFRACGNTNSRAATMELCGQALRIVSIEDLVARTALLCMDLAEDAPIPAKHAQDFLRLLPLVEIADVETVWHDHRKPHQPPSFNATALLLRKLIATRKDLQITPVYSQDVTAACSRCQATHAFPLADVGVVRSLLGYC
jgi:hypothetical protein